MKSARTLIIVVIVLIASAVMDSCTGQTEADLADWSVFLRWLAAPGGGSIVVGVLVSVGYEYVPAFGKLVPKWKRVAFLGMCLVVPIAGAGLGILTDGWPATWRDTFWPALLTGINVFGSGTIAHTPRLPNAPLPIEDS